MRIAHNKNINIDGKTLQVDIYNLLQMIKAEILMRR
jgi:hypothetical protein